MRCSAVIFFLLLTAGAAHAAPRPERIVSINLCADDLAAELAEPAQLLAVTAYPHRPETQAVLDAAPHIKQLHGRFEEVMALDPDLVLAGRFSPRETVQLLRKMGVPVYIVGVPENLEDIGRHVRLLAERLGAEEKGEALARRMEERLTALKKDSGSGPRTVIWGPGGHIPGTGTFEDAVLQAAGARNLAAELGIEGHSWISVEELIHARPDVLILSAGRDDRDSLSAQILNHPAVRRGLPGVKIIHLPPDSLRCGSPYTLNTIEWLKEQIN